MDDPNLNDNLLDNLIKTTLDKHMPAKLVKYKKHEHKKSDWITQGIVYLIKFIDKMYQKLRKTPVSDNLYNTLMVNLRKYNRI